jgi:YVTN family beta-propeller protein
MHNPGSFGPAEAGHHVHRHPAAILASAMLASVVACGGGSKLPAGLGEPNLRVYASNEASGDISVIDPTTRTVIATVKVGKRPRGLVISADGKKLYVALSGSPNAGPGVDPKTLPPPDRSADGIGEVDLVTNKLTRVIHAGNDPEQLDVSADGTRLYVANEDAAQASVVDLKSGTVIATAKTGDEPEGVRLRPDGKVVYVTSEEDGDVAAIDTATNMVLKRIPVGHRPRGIGFLPDGSRAFVTLENDGAVAVIDSQRHEFLQRIQFADPDSTPRPRPMGITVRPDGTMIYITTGSFGQLFLLDPATNALAGMMPVGQRPWGVGLLPDGRTLYTANGPSNDVSVVDLTTRQVVKKIPVGDRPWGIAVLNGAAPR